MNNAIIATPSATLTNWNDPEMQLQIKNTYGKGLDEGEWKLFLQLGISTGLNPFLREIWAVKYGTNPASIFIGRDGYRRSAQNHPEYEYHFADAVYANDVYKIVNGEVTHEYTLKDRGALVGAYCIVKRRNSGRAAITFVELKEYYQGNKLPDGSIKKNKYGDMKPTLWDTKPSTMIKKVAEAQGLRASFQELFAGTYEESENWNEEKPAITEKKDPVVRAPTSQKSQENVVDVAQKKAQPEKTKGLKVWETKMTPDQMKRLWGAWEKYKVECEMPEAESMTKIRELMQSMFGVSVSTSLDEEKAEQLIVKIQEMTLEASM